MAAGRSRTAAPAPVDGSFSSSEDLPALEKKTNSKLPLVGMKEVEKHDSPTDAWIVVDHVAYDVTEFSKKHPGGRVILTWAGMDATEVFSVMHARSTYNILPAYAVGRVDDATYKVPAILSDFRDMHDAMRRDGLFQTSFAYYAYKNTTQLALLASSMALLFTSHGSYAKLFASACLLGLFWQQSGWLAHDYCHNQVHTNRRRNRIMGLLWGNVMQGFSVGWWKDKHNTHHASTNLLDDEFMPVDPDIDTLPMLAWSREQLEATVKVYPTMNKVLMRYQHYLVGPILLFARMSWSLMSLLQVVSMVKGTDPAFAKNVKATREEVVGMVLHYSWLVGAIAANCTFTQGLFYYVAAQCVGGLFLGYVFIQSHNGMSVHLDEDLKKDFFTNQMLTTRNIHSTAFNDWFTGGLNKQIEHHLFPNMPRHSLGKAGKYVKAMCDKHRIAYEDVGMIEASCKVVRRLHEIAQYVN